MLRFCGKSVGIASVLVCLPAIASAQANSSLETGRRHFSFQPRPQELCDHFMITETGALYRFSGAWYPDDGSSPYQSDEPRYLFTADCGIMSNIEEKLSLGGALFLNISSDAWKIGVMPKLRYWFGKSTYGDLSPGLYFIGGSSKSDLQLPNLSVQTSFGLSNWISLTAQMEVMSRIFNQVYVGAPTGKTWTDVSWYAGLRLGSYAGVVAAVCGGVVALIIAAIVSAMYPLDWEG